MSKPSWAGAFPAVTTQFKNSDDDLILESIPLGPMPVELRIEGEERAWIIALFEDTAALRPDVAPPARHAAG
ncbi:MAG: hypothetical protein IID55_04335 [Proteobacteria bacterium]|nr:hypothetical protein [Pseudomonadota bacterium]